MNLFRPEGAVAKRALQVPLPIDQQLRDTLAGNLRAIRKAVGLSQTELADQANLSRKHISSIENGTANVSLDVVSALASQLGRTTIDLLTPGQFTRAQDVT